MRYAFLALCLILLPACSARQTTTSYKPEIPGYGSYEGHQIPSRQTTENDARTELRKELQSVILELTLQFLERLLVSLIERELNGLSGNPRGKVEVRRILIQSGFGTAGRTLNDHLHPRYK